MYTGLRVKYQLFSSDFNDTWIFSTHFRKILKYQISLNSVQWEPSCSMRTDRQTDMMNLIVAFRKFANAPKKAWIRYKFLYKVKMLLTSAFLRPGTDTIRLGLKRTGKEYSCLQYTNTHSTSVLWDLAHLTSLVPHLLYIRTYYCIHKLKSCKASHTIHVIQHTASNFHWTSLNIQYRPIRTSFK
jgi:hypothetical protein